MRRFIGAFTVALLFIACGLELGGPETATPDGGSPDVVTTFDASNDQTVQDSPVDAMVDVTYDVPDFGVGETEAGIPCTCVGAIPNGWTAVAYDPAMQNACPMNYSMPQNKVEGSGANPTCSCACNGIATAPTCDGKIDIAFGWGDNNTCMVGGDTLNGVDTACTPMNKSYMGGQKFDYVSALNTQNPAVSGGTCNTPTITAIVPPPAVTHGRTCKAASVGSCGSNNECMPDVSGSDNLCIQIANSANCPANFPVKHQVGSAYNDTRACPSTNTCKCTITNPGVCSTPSFSFYSDTACQTAVINNLTTNGTCTNLGLPPNQGFKSAIYTTSNSGSACGFSGMFNPSGSFTYTNLMTICCRP